MNSSKKTIEYGVPSPFVCTCGNAFGLHFKKFYQLVIDENVKASDALNKLGIRRMCCRRGFFAPTMYVMNCEDKAFINEVTGEVKGMGNIEPKIKFPIVEIG